MSRKHLLISVATLSFVSLLVWPTLAEAQRRGPVRPPRGGSIVIVGGGFGQLPWGPYGQWGPWGPYGPYGPWGPWGPGPYSRYYDTQPFASARVEVEPNTAEVYVDGSRAGIVDDFDGFFQRLNVRPGEHEITLYLEGYRTQNHRLYFSPGTTQSIKGTMEKLAAGESSGPRPEPAPAPAAAPRGIGQGREPNPPPAPAQPARFGTLSVKVLPAEADIVVDDQHWTSAVGELRLAIKLSAGRHHIEVKKDGFETYVEDILIRSDATMTLNVSLTKK